MTQDDIKAALETSTGKPVKIAFDNHTDTVTVISTDPDGFLCRANHTGQSQEFWLAYTAVYDVQFIEERGAPH